VLCTGKLKYPAKKYSVFKNQLYIWSMNPTLAPRLLLLLLLLLSACFTIQAQVHFRHYEPGRYYDRAGVRHTGFIDFGANVWGTVKINFKEGTDTAANQKIGISDIKALVVSHQADTAGLGPGAPNIARQQMVIDSFVVLQENLYASDSTATEARLCKFVTDAVNSKIFSRNVQKSAGGFGMGIGSIGAISMAVGASMSYTDTLYLCEAEGKTLQIKRNNYKQLLAKAFADYPDLVQKIQTKELRFGELGEIIRKYIAHKTS
jgi:hypothetical protein